MSPGKTPYYFFAPLHTPSGEARAFDVEYAREVLEVLGEAGVHTTSALSWLVSDTLGSQPPARVGLILPASERAAQHAQWAALISECGAACAAPMAPARFDETPESLQPGDLGAMLGLGLVCASAGWSGVPLVGLGITRLREELTRSREFLSAHAGFPIQALVPSANALGVAVDALILREAWSAGYRQVITEPLQPVRASPPHHLIATRLEPGKDRPAALVRKLAAPPTRLGEAAHLLSQVRRRGARLGRYLLDERDES